MASSRFRFLDNRSYLVGGVKIKGRKGRKCRFNNK